MKVKIGPYLNWWGPYQIAEMILFWMDKDEDERVRKFGKWLSEDRHGNDSYLTKVCTWVHSKRHRKVKIRIDEYDTWGMDHTLGLIILPMLKQLKETKHGSPYIDDEDLPPELRLTKREKAVHENGYWNKKLKATEAEIEAASKKFHSQWDWVMDQMIWSFEQDQDEDEGRQFYYDPFDDDEIIPREELLIIHTTDDNGNDVENPMYTIEEARKRGRFNKEKHRAYAEKKQLGFTLFGKYFQNLWD
jgi:hypothetical protein